MRRRKRKKVPRLIVFGLLSTLLIVLFMNYDTLHVTSKSAMIMDASTGKVLYEKNAKNGYPVASISKLMTEYIVLEKIATGEINWEEPVVISETANNLIGSAVKLPVGVGDVLSVDDLFTAMVVASSNNAAIALAEHIAGTEEAFTQLMNEHVPELGLSKQTTFVNATGLPNPAMGNAENTMSAVDIAKLAQILLASYQTTVLAKANLQSYYIESHGIEIVTTNQMLQQNGVDGLKTGFTQAAGYSFVGTAKQEERRLITVVIDAEDEDARFAETNILLDFGFKEKSMSSIKGFAERVKAEVKSFIRN